MKNILIFLIIFALLATLVFRMTPAQTLFELGVSAERKLAGLTVKQVEINDGTISYLEGGQGDPLILLHGFGANKDNWNRLAKHLSNDYHIIAIDMPGFGDSFRNISLDHDAASQVNRLNEIVEKLSLDSFHIAGNSMGGYIAGNYATSHANKVQSLWLIDPLGVAESPKSEMFELISQKKRPIVLAKNKLEYKELLSFVFYEMPYTPDFFIDELAKQAEQDFILHQKIFQDIHHLSDFTPNFTQPLDLTLKNFDKPVLITWGDKDRILHPKGAELLWAVVPHAKIELMENIGHLPMLEAPDKTAKQFIVFSESLKNN